MELEARQLLCQKYGLVLDHPVLVGLPESEYLKVLVVERGGSDPAAVAPKPVDANP